MKLTKNEILQSMESLIAMRDGYSVKIDNGDGDSITDSLKRLALRLMESVLRLSKEERGAVLEAKIFDSFLTRNGIKSSEVLIATFLECAAFMSYKDYTEEIRKVLNFGRQKQSNNIDVDNYMKELFKTEFGGEYINGEEECKIMMRILENKNGDDWIEKIKKAGKNAFNTVWHGGMSQAFEVAVLEIDQYIGEESFKKILNAQDEIKIVKSELRKLQLMEMLAVCSRTDLLNVLLSTSGYKENILQEEWGGFVDKIKSTGSAQEDYISHKYGLFLGVSVAPKQSIKNIDWVLSVVENDVLAVDLKVIRDIKNRSETPYMTNLEAAIESHLLRSGLKIGGANIGQKSSL